MLCSSLRTIATVLLLSQLSGCAILPAYQVVMWGATGFSYATSGKSLTDHVVSSALEKDCSLARLLTGRLPCAYADSSGTVTVVELESGNTWHPAWGSVTPTGKPANTRADGGPAIGSFDDKPKRYIVVASYADVLNAITHADNSTDLNIVQADVDGTRYFRVLDGPYDDTDAAEAQAADAWTLWLCPADFSVPPCGQQRIAVSSINTTALQ